MRIFAFLFLCLAPSALAAECLDDFLVVDREETWDLSHPDRFDIFLPTRSGNTGYVTQAAAHYQWPDSSELRVHFDFNLPPGQVSYPYNVYKIEIDVGDETNRFHIEQDFTRGCTESGAGMFPGQKIALPAIKIPPRSNGEARAEEPVRIRIWGLHF